VWDDGAQTHTQKWVQRGEPGHGNLELLESHKTDEVEGCVGSHKMHIFTANIPTFHSRYRR
jgi:hypothetical protein